MDKEIKDSIECALDKLFDDAFYHPSSKDYLLKHSDATYDVVRCDD